MRPLDAQEEHDLETADQEVKVDLVALETLLAKSPKPVNRAFNRGIPPEDEPNPPESEA